MDRSDQRWLFCGISHPTKKNPNPMGKNPMGFSQKVWDKNPKKIPWDWKIPGFPGNPKKIPKMKKRLKMKKNKKSEKNYKLKIKEKITTVDIPLSWFFRRLFRDLKFLRNCHKTNRLIEMFYRGFFSFEQFSKILLQLVPFSF